MKAMSTAMLRRQHLVFLLALPATISFLYLWQCVNQETPLYAPADILGDDATEVISQISFGSTSEPATFESPPSTDFLDLAYQQRLPASHLDPYPIYNSRQWRSRWRGIHRPCQGPRGSHVNGNKDDMLLGRKTTLSAPNPNPMFGGFNETGLDGLYCFDRFGRFGPYGLNDDDERGIFEEMTFDWKKVNWGSLQNNCIQRNGGLFGVEANQTNVLPLTVPGKKSYQTKKKPEKDSTEKGLLTRSQTRNSKPYVSRKAVLIKVHHLTKYNEEATYNLRSMITELTLHTGGEYAVYLLVEITDPDRQIHTAEAVYKKALWDFVPSEFQGIALLYNTKVLEAWYPKVGYAGGSTLHSNQALQIFSQLNPQFSHIWGMDFGVRYTGNWYGFFSNAMNWARQQPRKLQWERAEKFFIPSHHGTYTKFSSDISAWHNGAGVWGPVFNSAVEKPLGPDPPSNTPQEDDFFWGVGEDADDIVPSVLVKPDHADIFQPNEVGGFEPGSTRRASIIPPVNCLSRTLLSAMHEAQLRGIDMRPELFPHTMALMHGLKAVSLPVPIFFDNATMPVEDVDGMFNDPTKLFFVDEDNEWTHPIKAKATYWSRLGGGMEQYSQQLYGRWYGVDREGKQLPESQVGRLCLPGMLIHPVMDVVHG